MRTENDLNFSGWLFVMKLKPKKLKPKKLKAKKIKAKKLKPKKLKAKKEYEERECICGKVGVHQKKVASHQVKHSIA